MIPNLPNMDDFERPKMKSSSAQPPRKQKQRRPDNDGERTAKTNKKPPRLRLSEEKRVVPQAAEVDAPVVELKEGEMPGAPVRKKVKEEWVTDPRTGKKYKKLPKTEWTSRQKDGSGLMSVSHVSDEDMASGFDGGSLEHAADIFLAHLRVPPNLKERERLRKEREEMIKKQNAAIKRAKLKQPDLYEEDSSEDLL